MNPATNHHNRFIPPCAALLLFLGHTTFPCAAQSHPTTRPSDNRKPDIAALTASLAENPRQPDRWADLLAAHLDSDHPAAALAAFHDATTRLKPTPELHFLAARAHATLHHPLGHPETRTIPHGRPGQIHDDWLLLESRPGRDRFFCASADSALYQLRRALDAGYNHPPAHLLHARLWLEARRPRLAHAALAAHADRLTITHPAATAALQADIALALNDLPAYARLARRHAAADPDHAPDILFTAYRTLAERYAERGEENLHICFLRSALHHNPQHLHTRLALADALHHAGRHAAATPHYHAALRQNPPAPLRRQILQRLAPPTSPPR